MRRGAALAVVLPLVLAPLAACGGEEPSARDAPESGAPTSSAPAEPVEPVEEPAPDGPGSPTPCAEPEDGWILDPGRLSAQDRKRALRVARSLDDHARSWVDRRGDDASLWIVNVRAVDVSRAATTVRRVWGGGLCVTEP